MKNNSIYSRLTTLLVAATLVIISALALSSIITDAAYAAEDKTTYDYKASSDTLETMPGVYRVQVDPNSADTPKTIGIPSVAKQNLENQATKEMPGIIMGAAVNYEVRTGAIDFTPIGGAELLPPYSYFRWKYMEKEEKDPDGTIRKIKTLTGFDGSYYIIRIDMSKIIAAAKEKAAATGETIEGKYLHVLQDGNKALLTATGLTDYSYVWANTNQTGNKAAAYSLADNGKYMQDTEGSDNKTPYYDVILMSSAKNVAGADAGGQDTPDGNVNLTFYVDDTKDYKPWLKKTWAEVVDPNNLPSAENPLVIDGHPYADEKTYNADMEEKFFDADKATTDNSVTKYKVMGGDLEIDSAINVNTDSSDEGIDPQGRDWLGEGFDFWSMEKAIANEKYDNHTIIMICEVPVLNGLSISGSGDKTRNVILDVNSFDIQIANNTEEGKAGLVIGGNSYLRIKDGSNTAGAELAIGNNATMVIEKGGTMIIDETCTTETEFDAASTVDPSTTPAKYISGEITVQEGGQLINWGVINIEGPEGKPLDPSQQEQVVRDKQSADILVENGALLDNYGCISLKGSLYLMGLLNNYGKYNDIIHAYDPDKNRIDYHKGIQVTWKDDVRQDGVIPGILNVGIDSKGTINKDAILNNYGDIVMCPGTLNLYGTLNNNKHEGLNTEGHIYLSNVDEAIVPIVNPTDPTVVEERISINPPKESVLNIKNGTFNGVGGSIGYAKVALVHNGVLGELTPISTDEIIAKEDKAVTDAEAAVKTAQEELDKLDTAATTDQVKAAYKKLVDAKDTLAKANLRLATAEQTKALAAIAESETKLEQANKDKETLEEQKTALEGEKANLEAAVDKLNKAIENANKDNEALQNKNEELQTKLTNTNNQLSETNAKLEETEAALKAASDAAKQAEADKKAAQEAATKAEADKKAAEEAAAKAEADKKAAEKNALAALKKVTLKKAKGGKKKATITWKKVTGANGYEVLISKNKKGTKSAKTYTLKKNTAKKVIKKLKKGKYYVKVRAYKNYQGNKLYGKYSKAKKFKVK